MAEVILKEVKKDFGKSTVINDVSIKINEGDFCVIVVHQDVGNQLC